MSHKFYQVDAFGAGSFTGNPAAVCPVDRFPTEELMQQIAAEHNLSETAFYHGKDGEYHLRWFTPEAEVDLCGHATLAAAHVIFTESAYVGTEVRFFTKSGELSVQKLSEGRYDLQLPADEIHEVDLGYNFIKALGAQPLKTFRGKTDLLLVYSDAAQVEGLKPNFELLKALPVRGVIATAPGIDVDFVSRFFAPTVGVNEDPATGSAHTTLGAYWRQALEQSTFRAIQLSRRKGYFGCRIDGKRIVLSGHAFTFMKGEMFLPVV